MARGGARPNAGAKPGKVTFDVACLLGTATGKIEFAMKMKQEEYDKRGGFSDMEKEQLKVAIEVFKKIAPTNINLGGQKDNPLTLLVEELHQKAKEYDAKSRGGS